MTRVEFRVRWRREGRAGSRMIFQTEKAARAKIDRLLALEEVKGDVPRFEDMPDLVGAPTLEARLVGEWAAAPDPPAAEASGDARASMAVWTAADGGVFS